MGANLIKVAICGNVSSASWSQRTRHFALVVRDSAESTLQVSQHRLVFPEEIALQY